MRIGVICEGPSDYPALEHFFGHSLRKKGLQPQFRPLFPALDRTRPDGGWANVLLWLMNHSPERRIQTYFRGGLFGGSLSTDALDAIIVQLDTDVLEDDSFRTFVFNRYGLEIVAIDGPDNRAQKIREILEAAAQFQDMTNADCARHVLAPSVESTETWCVAAFHPQQANYEELRGQDLITAFMRCLEISEGREPQEQYATIDKNFNRRSRYCATHAAGAERIANSCTQFNAALLALGPPDPC